MFLGKELGARPDDSSCYEGGCVNFQQIAKREEFKRGLERLFVDIPKYRIALMCAEKDPLQCHRTILIARYLREDFCIKHILADGNIEDNIEAERRLVGMLKMGPALFEPMKEEAETIQQAYDQQAKRICYRAKKLQNNI